MPALGDLDGHQGEVVGLLRVRGLEHGHAGGHGVAAVVLLVLAGGHARIVGGDDHQARLHVRVGGGEQRVGGHVQPDVLHGDQGAGAAEGRPQAHLQGHLLVGRPLGAAAQLVERLQDLSGRRARIARPEPHPGMQGGKCNGLVPTEESWFYAHRSETPWQSVRRPSLSTVVLRRSNPTLGPARRTGVDPRQGTTHLILHRRCPTGILPVGRVSTPTQTQRAGPGTSGSAGHQMRADGVRQSTSGAIWSLMFTKAFEIAAGAGRACHGGLV